MEGGRGGGEGGREGGGEREEGERERENAQEVIINLGNNQELD